MSFSFDPFDFAVHADPYPFYRVLRDSHPVYWSEGAKCFVLSRHADVFSALHSVPRFSNTGGNVIDDSRAKLGRTVGSVDPPRHGELRGLVNEAFNRRQVAKEEAFIAETVARLLHGRQAPFDLVRDVTSPLSGAIMAQLLGLEGADLAEFKRLLDISLFRDPVTRARTPEGEAAQAEMFRLTAAQVEKRRDNPGEDMISALLAMDLEPESTVWMARAVFGAGFESTSSFLANACLAFMRNPAQARLLREAPALLPQAIEEALRYETPAQRFARLLLEDTEMHGVTMPAGSKIMLLYGSANRDERAFDRPEEFDITRKPGRHMALGHGIHFCAGAALARSIAGHFLPVVLPLLEQAKLPDGPLQWAHSPTFRSLTALPLRPA
ncbi:cytochrome P450 [Rhodovarius crocodyli]|nr:cytochrome P450 [Rhodovarius crocodyli]